MTISILLFLHVLLTMWPIKRRALCSLYLNQGRSLGLSQPVEYVRSECMCLPRLRSKNNSFCLVLNLSLSSSLPPLFLSCHPFLLSSCFPMMLTIGRQLLGCEEAQTTWKNWHTEELRLPADGQHQPASWLSEAPWKWILQTSFPPWLWHQLTSDWNLTNHQAKPQRLIPDPQTLRNDELFLVSMWYLRARTCQVL